MRLRRPARPGTQLAGRLYDSTLPRPVRRVAAGLSWRLRRIARPGTVVSDDRGPVSGEVVAYFGEDRTRLYQIQQWLPVFERLDQTHPVLVVTRHEDSMLWIRDHTALRVVLAPTFRDLSDVYARVDPKVALYVNNGNQNFQSLSSTRMLHVHINHGESDKVSMVSNQAKSYDRVFVAGEAAVRRHRVALLDLDESKLVRIGRPQLDLELKPALPPSDRATVVYAPTWEGENEANNYTSIDLYGPAITAAALARPDLRFVYKPHPRIPTSRVPAVRAGHLAVVEQIESAAHADPSAGHKVLRSGDVLRLIKQADLVVSDVSSVTLDYLYLRTERPLLLTDRRTDPARLAEDAPVSVACQVIDATTIARVGDLIAHAVQRDDQREDRRRMRELYFGELEHGQSTQRFLDEVDALVALRDQGLAAQGRSVADASLLAEDSSDDEDDANPAR